MPAKCFGPYLLYAISTKFVNFEAIYDENKGFRLLLLVEFKPDVQWQDFLNAMNKKAGPDFGVQLGPPSPGQKDSRYATAHCRKAVVTDAAALSIWDEYASRVELSLPMRQQGSGFFHGRAPLRVHSTSMVLIGVLDDGCPFAAERFLRGPADTRLWAIWDQDPGKVPTMTNHGQFGQFPTDFLYGCEYRRLSAGVGAGRVLGLNEWIDDHTTAAVVDEDSCYADAQFDTLKYRASHGAHVMDVIAGPTPTASRVSLDRLNPPSFGALNDEAHSADIVFVQFSRASVEDPTGVWLDAYVLDGLRYILSCAIAPDGSFIYPTVIVNLSYGRTTGPHNGSSALEQALSEFVNFYNGCDGKPRLHISLAAGNYYLTDNHVVFKNDTEEPATFCWTWRLPPDNTSLCFAEIWMSNGGLESVKVSLTSPSGVIFGTTTSGAPAGVEGPVAWAAEDTMWRLQVEATVFDDPPAVVAEHGLYTVTVAGVPPGKTVHGYVARTDPNMDVPPGPQPSFFVDEKWEQGRAASAGCTYANGEFDNRGCVVSEYGTLNGIATGLDDAIHVAGGYILSSEGKSTYSSAGPARKGPLPRRMGPDYLMLGDESPALQGVPGGGNRSGVVFRLIGTSAAAPQLGRWFADGAPPAASNTPAPGDVEGVEQRGGGNLKPP